MASDEVVLCSDKISIDKLTHCWTEEDAAAEVAIFAAWLNDPKHVWFLDYPIYRGYVAKTFDDLCRMEPKLQMLKELAAQRCLNWIVKGALTKKLDGHFSAIVMGIFFDKSDTRVEVKGSGYKEAREVMALREGSVIEVSVDG